MSVIFTPISTGYRLEEPSVSRAERLVTELIYYMKTELSLGDFTEENFPEYKKQLENVPDGLFGIDKENMANQKNLTYTRSRQEALEAVDIDGADCSFILNPTKVVEIRDVALASERCLRSLHTSIQSSSQVLL